jgi:Protein of unknown function (DUF2891)
MSAATLCPRSRRVACHMDLSAHPSALANALARCIQLGLECIPREYPHASQGTLQSDSDVKSPRQLWPVFFGCYDWHSAVHNHWQLVRGLHVAPNAAWARDAASLLHQQLQPDKIAHEAAYLARFPTFEMPYGIAWLHTLCAEVALLAQSTSPHAKSASTWLDALAPLHDTACRNTLLYWTNLVMPNRTGAHPNTAFAAGLMLDAVCAHPSSHSAAIEHSIRDYVAKRVHHAPRIDATIEPLGYDFISPSLCEADLARRVMDAHAFRVWLTHACPHLATLQPLTPMRPEDGQQSHFDGLNISRAWMLQSIAAHLQPDHAATTDLLQSAAAHAAAGLSGSSHLHYSGQHWLGSFAMYLLTQSPHLPPSNVA